MNLINLIAFATALLPSTVCVLAQVVRPDFTPGRCTFWGTVHRDCNSKGKMTTYLNVSPFYDHDGKQFMMQTDAVHLTDGLTLTGPVAGHPLHIAYVDDGVTYTSSELQLRVRKAQGKQALCQQEFRSLGVQREDSD
ncbi:hypothetical protein TUN199_08254 [Pyrenophora tritici-repentis]|uniref:Uncharacterized protein n=1 Tax=Pyrenophora tritici-repentis TaxID=45151 RepID=A0A2W1HMF2_9PLEO|nr:hypothetical protein PtrV1_08037 [Pyrenophora tritici-repentis]KAF7570917.1 hypothetical protein PtrM4_109190 [Pyrenophora tritici-repentis]KAI0574397.1 hypothetical protein Alg215_08610 [Pyrenophora tritici-repentis]KAI0577559.1 hypothetical protein Alg130_08319 [Pyrenophora tritici-repentis]KAI0607445.1 hypothetical protein TUN205_08304 [Pyrenophora tritici-repentis]